MTCFLSTTQKKLSSCEETEQNNTNNVNHFFMGAGIGEEQQSFPFKENQEV